MGSTNGSYSKVYLVVSDTEPENPTDGLLWYNPDLCTTTTTTTIFCEGPLCETVLTVGQDGANLGYRINVMGSINPLCDNLTGLGYSGNQLALISYQFNCDEVTVIIDNNVYTLPYFGTMMGECLYIIEVEENPFPEVGEKCNVKICGSICTTTTTTIQE